MKALSDWRKIDEVPFEGFRVLGIAWREVEPERSHADIADESELSFAWVRRVLGSAQGGRAPSASGAGRVRCRFKIVTGDNEQVTRHVCAALGVPVRGVVNGAELTELSDDALAARLPTTNLFCRVTPPQ